MWVLILTWASGTWKTSITQNLCNNFWYKLYSWYTTREKREWEIHKKDYFFLTVDKFLQIKNMLFWDDWTNTYNWNYYWLSKYAVKHKVNKYKDLIILPNWVTVAEEIYKFIKNYQKQIVWIHLYTDKKTLEQRLNRRWEMDIETRLNFWDSIWIVNSKNTINIEVSKKLKEVVKEIIWILNLNQKF